MRKLLNLLGTALVLVGLSGCGGGSGDPATSNPTPRARRRNRKQYVSVSLGLLPSTLWPGCRFSRGWLPPDGPLRVNRRPVPPKSLPGIP